MLFGGDFRQVLPVLRHAERAKIVRMTITRWKEWRKVRQLQLLDNMCVRRVYDDPASADRFAAWLLRVGDGRETTVQDTDLIRVPSDMIVHSIAELVNSVFPDLSDERLYVNRAILAPKNDDADEVNDFVVNQLTGTICEYKSVESFDTNECAQYPIVLKHPDATRDTTSSFETESRLSSYIAVQSERRRRPVKCDSFVVRSHVT